MMETQGSIVDQMRMLTTTAAGGEECEQVWNLQRRGYPNEFDSQEKAFWSFEPLLFRLL